jgi:flap endonuclease-1
MGVPIGDLLEKEEITLDSLANKTLGVDGFNITYQFLTTIRDLNGEYLTNSKGRVTSHIIGLFYRITKLLEQNINLVFVFDGKALELKKATQEKRSDIKIDVEKNIEAKKLAGEHEAAAQLMKRTARITTEMLEDAKELLDAFNIQHFEALHDGEAQLSVMNLQGQIDGIISQDYDVLLLGGKDLYRNIGISGKKKAPGKDYYLQVKPERINLQQNLAKLNLTREKLIWLGMLVGTDFNEKVPKVGPKTAIKLVSENNSLDEIFAKLEYKPNFDYNEVFDIFWKPKTKDIELQKFERPNFEKIKKLLIEKYEFNEERVNNTLNALEKTINEKKSQKTLWG